jgi:hypothetical protein
MTEVKVLLREIVKDSSKMKRAIINLQIQCHELVGQELREPISLEDMKTKGVPQRTVVHIDGEDEEQLLRKVREWIAATKT